MSTNLIPVLTVDDKKYNQPTQNKGGLYVVNKEVLQGTPSNKFVFYNQDNGKYYHINEQTASADYLKQINEYEQRLQNIGTMQADTTDPTQVNSLADIASMLFAGDLKGVYQGVPELLHNKVVRPLVTPELKGQRTVTLVNNLLVNLGETMDYFTGASAIKALLQNKSVKDTYVWDNETGRAQYDWNVETGSVVTNLTTNFFLEFVSDPTNWITLGGKSLVGNAIKSSVDDVAASMGLTVNKKYLNSFTRGMYESFGSTDSFRNVDLRKLFDLSDVTTLDDATNILKNLNTSLEAKKAFKHAELINSVMGTSDAIEKAAFRATMSTSTLGLEGMAIKAVSKKWVLPWFNSKLGSILKHNKINGEFAIADHVKIIDEVKELNSIVSELTGMYDEVSDDIVNNATKSMQLKAVKDIQDIFTKYENSHQAKEFFDELNGWAVQNGFKNIAEAHVSLSNIAKHLDGGLKEVVNLIEAAVRRIKGLQTEQLITGLEGVRELIERAKRTIAPLDLDRDYHGNTPFESVLKNNHALNTTYKNLDILKVSEKNKAVLRDVLNTAVRGNIIESMDYIVNILYNTPLSNKHIINGLLGMLKSLKKSISKFPATIDSHTILDKAIKTLTGILRTGGSHYAEIDEFVEMLEVMHKTQLTDINWEGLLEQSDKTIREQMDEIIKEVILDDDVKVDFSAYRAAVSRYGTNNPASKALKDMLDIQYAKQKQLIPDTKGTFLHSPTEGDVDNTPISFSDVFPYGSEAGSFKELADNLEQVFSWYNLYDVDQDLGLISKMLSKETITLSEAEELIDILRRRGNAIAQTDETNASVIKYFADMLEDVVDSIKFTEFDKVLVDEVQLSSKLFATKLSQADSLHLLLNTPEVLSMVNAIQKNEGIGAFIKMLENVEDTAHAAETLHALAVSSEEYGKLLNKLYNNPAIGSEWAGALVDSLAGIMRSHWSDIHLDNLTDLLLTRAKTFINKSNNNLPNISKYVDRAYLPSYVVGAISRYLNNPNITEQIPEIADMYKAFRDFLGKSKSLDVIYSIGQSSKRAGVFEFVCELPEELPGYGSYVHFVSDVTDAKKLLGNPHYAKEILGLNAPVKAEVYAPNAIHFKTNDEFAAAISQFLETLKAHANPFDSKQRREIRFIGWGNSADNNNQDEVFNKFLQRNKISFKIDDMFSSAYTAKSVDLKSFIYSEGGAAIVTDPLKAAVKNALADSKQVLDMWNNRFREAQAYLMPDLSKDVLTAIDTVTAYVEQALRENATDVPELLTSYSKKVLGDMYSQLRNFSNGLSGSLRNIRKSNAYMARELIVDSMLKKFSGERNIMQFLQKYMIDGFHEGVPELALKTYHDPALVASWFDMSTPLFKEIKLGDLLRINKLLSHLQSTVDNITRPELLYAASSLRSSEKVIGVLHNILKQHGTSSTTRYNISFIEKMQTGLTPEQTFAIASYYARELDRLPNSKATILKDSLIKGWTNSDPAALNYFGLARNADDTVLSKDGLYVLDIPTSRFDEGIDDTYEVYEALEAVKEIDRIRTVSDCFKDELVLEDEILSKFHTNDSSFRLKFRMLRAFSSFVDAVSGVVSGHKNYYKAKMADAQDALAQFTIKQDYTLSIKNVKELLDQLGEYHAHSRIKNIFGMSLEDYERYLFKYSQGIQLIDTRATIFQNEVMASRLFEFVKKLKNAPDNTSIRVKEIPNSGYVAVYLDKDVMETKLEDETFRDSFKGLRMHFELEEVAEDSELKNNLFLKEYLEVMREVEHTHNVAYSMSMHRAMNKEVFDELWDFLPVDLKTHLFDKNHWLAWNYLQNGLNHTMIGDYNSGLGTVYRTYSGNVMSNVVSGISKLYRQAVSREAYVTFFTSPINSLKARVDMIKDVSGESLTYRDVSAALEHAGYKAVSFDGKDLKVWDTSTERGLQDAFDNNAVCIDADVYDRVFRTVVDNTLPEELTKKPFFSYLLLLKLGQLQSPGWVIRNILDSTVKGMVATGGGLDYIAMFPEVVRKLTEFDKILNAVYKEYNSTSANKIRKFFKEKPELASTFSLTLEDMLDYYKFSKDSASVPTPAQLSILNNVKERLSKFFVDNTEITGTHIDSLLKAFVDGQGNRKLTHDKLVEALPFSRIVNTLMGAFNEIPKGYAKIKSTNFLSKAATYLTEHSPLMKANNWIERVERFLAYDYSRQMGKTTGAAIDIVNASQFNRAYDSVGRRMLELVFPFSAFQVDNMMFWINALSAADGSILGTLTDYLQSRYDEEELTVEEIVTNASVQYMFLSGNILIDEDNDLVLKVNDSLSNTMQMIADPVGTMKEALLVPGEKIIDFIKGLAQDEEEYDANPYGKVPPISRWLKPNDGGALPLPYVAEDFAFDLIPLFGAWWLRQQTAWEETATPLTKFFRIVAPSVFGKVKRTGYDWYDQTEEYRKSHVFVPGISYVPKWLLADPRTYVNTIQRLVNTGYDEETATKMVTEWGYYMKAPDYTLRQHKPYVPKVKPVRMVYPKKVYAQRPVYTKKVYPKKVYAKTAKMISGGDRYRTTRFGVARIYRLTSMYDRITKSGTSRMTMMLSRGHGASSIRVVRDRIKNNTIRRQRQRRILHM